MNILREALSSYKVLVDDSFIDLYIDGKIMPVKIRLIEPARQLCLLNTEPYDLSIVIKVSAEL